MQLDEETRNKIDSTIKDHSVVLFMKGNRSMPQCGFSATVVQILNEVLDDYQTVNVLADPALREGIKVFSNWPTIPQLYVNGEFIGGCDIVKDMHASGDLVATLGVTIEPMVAPSITITDAAAEKLLEALESAGDDVMLHLTINKYFEPALQFGPRSPAKCDASNNGVSMQVDRGSIERAEGLTIDFLDGPEGSGFKVDNPNAPKPVKELSPTDVRTLLEAKPEALLIDVRTDDEHSIARIDGAQLLTEEYEARLRALPKETVLVFHCHHGGRSKRAAEAFSREGFQEVYNMTGGIHQWSIDVDPTIPNY